MTRVTKVLMLWWKEVNAIDFSPGGISKGPIYMGS
jgi:hypothetical protein